MKRTVNRGDIFYADLPVFENSEITHGRRPIVIVSNDKNNTENTYIQYVPLTKNIDKEKLPTHKRILCDDLDGESLALCEGLGVLPIKKLRNKVASIAPEWMKEIEKGIKIQIGLDE